MLHLLPGCRRPRRHTIARWIFGMVPMLALALPGPAAQAQPPIHLVVGLPAGGTVDTLARQIAEGLRTALRRPVIVENRPGAGGIIATEHVRNAPADGDTLLITPTTTFSLYPLTMDKLPYKETDFVPVAHVARFEYALGIGSAVPAHNADEYAALVRKDTNYGMYGAPGLGGPPQLYGQIFAASLGIRMTTIPYPGVPPMLIALQAGQISAAVMPAGELRRLAAAGKARIIATVGEKRSPALPEVPTFSELHVPVTEYGQYALYAPAATPSNVVQTLAAAVQQTLRDANVRRVYASLDMEPTGQVGQELSRTLSDSDRFWRAAAHDHPEIVHPADH